MTASIKSKEQHDGGKLFCNRRTTWEQKYLRTRKSQRITKNPKRTGRVLQIREEHEINRSIDVSKTKNNSSATGNGTETRYFFRWQVCVGHSNAVSPIWQCLGDVWLRPKRTVKSCVCRKHKVHIYLEYHSVCPLVGIGTPHPLSQRVCFPPEPKGEGGDTHSPACEGMGESQFWTAGEKA